jgi:hypothetical protein
VRVSDADPRRLGVHAAISVPGVPDEALPEYVPRDTDAAESGVRAKVTAVAKQGGFVLLVGGSSVGKTRSAVQAVKELLPDWWLVHPAGPAEVAALAAAPPLRTVVWLDELQRYLDGEHGLTGGVVRALLNTPHPAVVIGTMWPGFYEDYTAVPTPGGADPHSRAREVLDLAVIVRIGAAFSPAEQDRARAAATLDPRLRVALGAAGYGLTQTLAAAPQLVARWEDAQAASPYAWAVLTAALDAARLGARAPLSPEFLRAAAPGYCTSQQQAEAPKNWFKKALAYATAKLHGAAAALSPAGAGIGQIAGYTPADYLVQHASRERRSAPVPASTWDAVLSHIRDPDDTARLADSAWDRLLYRYAIPLYRPAADVGSWRASERLANLLEKRGDLDELRARADTGDTEAAQGLAWLLAQRGDLDEAMQVLRPPVFVFAGVEYADSDYEYVFADDESADADDVYVFAGNESADADDESADAGDEYVFADDESADADDEYTARRLADLLVEHGDLDEAAQILRPAADAGSWHAAVQLAALLEKRGDLDELRARADTGDPAAVWRLADLLAENGDLDEAAQILRPAADAGSWHAAVRLANLLAERGDLVC